MNNMLDIRIKSHNYSGLISYAWHKKITLEDVKEDSSYLYCRINSHDLNKLKCYYHVDIIKDYTKNNFLYILKNNMIKIITFLLSIIIFLILSNVIVEININVENVDLVNKLTKSLDNYGIKRLTFKKSYSEIENIKSKLSAEFHDYIEWLEIENVGMTYIVKVEMRKSKIINIVGDHCHVIATSNGMITNIKANKGNILVKNNQIVKEGDILISGDSALNEEIKGSVCANGLIYAEEWYNVTIDIPRNITDKIYTQKVRYNLLYEHDNRDYKIFRSRLSNYDTSKKSIIGLFNHKLYLLKEYEYINKSHELSEDELDNKINELVISKLDLSLRDDEKILYKNILKKDVNDSRIRVELFVTVEKLISKQITY